VQEGQGVRDAGRVQEGQGVRDGGRMRARAWATSWASFASGEQAPGEQAPGWAAQASRTWPQSRQSTWSSRRIRCVPPHRPQQSSPAAQSARSTHRGHTSTR